MSDKIHFRYERRFDRKWAYEDFVNCSNSINTLAQNFNQNYTSFVLTSKYNSHSQIMNDGMYVSLHLRRNVFPLEQFSIDLWQENLETFLTIIDGRLKSFKLGLFHSKKKPEVLEFISCNILDEQFKKIVCKKFKKKSLNYRLIDIERNKREALNNL
jgi:archaellum component FlaF (FlaF/FlaG flagellin family)